MSSSQTSTCFTIRLLSLLTDQSIDPKVIGLEKPILPKPNYTGVTSDGEFVYTQHANTYQVSHVDGATRYDIFPASFGANAEMTHSLINPDHELHVAWAQVKEILRAAFDKVDQNIWRRLLYPPELVLQGFSDVRDNQRPTIIIRVGEGEIGTTVAVLDHWPEIAREALRAISRRGLKDAKDVAIEIREVSQELVEQHRKDQEKAQREFGLVREVE